MSFRELGLWFTAKKCESRARVDCKCIVITGGNTGIGKETAIELAKRGARVVICCRSAQRAEKAIEEIKKRSSSENVVYYQLDLASLQSVRDCATKILEKEAKIDILINNAGIMMVPYEKTVDGYESQFAVNHLSHFLFTLLLIQRMQQSNTTARIINVSSIAHRGGNINFDDLNSEKKYAPRQVYSNSKLANILFTRELAKRTKDSNIRVYCLHPGLVSTEIGRNIDSYFTSFGFNFIVRLFGKSAEQGAQTTIYCAIDEKIVNESGNYYYECKQQSPSPKALDDEVAKKLWIVSLKMVGLDKDPLETGNEKQQ